MTDFVIKDGETLVFTGDSITDCGRRVEHVPNGDGYVKAVIDLITARYPERRITIINEGVGGNTAEDLWNRWHDDILVQNPSWISILIGINDLSRHMANPDVSSPKQFSDTFQRILLATREQTRAHTCLAILSPQRRSAVTSRDGGCSELHIDCRTLAGFQCMFHATQDLFMEQCIARQVSSVWNKCSLSGHLVIAHGLLKALEW
jgi:hypothetical protein